MKPIRPIITLPASLVFFFLLSALFPAAYAAEFDFHSHQQDQDNFSKWHQTQNNITLKVKASNNLTQNSSGFGVGNDDAPELDNINGHNEFMAFEFFDDQNKPLNVVLKKLTLKMFEPNVSQDKALLKDINGQLLTNLDSGLNFNASAGFSQDRHRSNSWSLQEAQKVFTGFTITPTKGSSFYVYALEVEAMNMPVVFTNKAPITVAEGQEYSHIIRYLDENPDSVEFTLTASPEGMTLDPLTHTLFWQPNFNAHGQYPIQVVATDDEGKTSSLAFTLDVKNTNQLPLFTSIPVLKSKETQKYSYTLKAMDKDQETVFFKLLDAPEHMTLNDETHTLSWAPGYQDAGDHLITVAASDAFDMKIQQYNLQVADTNRPPTIKSVAPDSISENNVYQYPVKAHDPDIDVLNYSLTHGPRGMIINPLTGVLTWPVDFNQAGKHQVEIMAVDNKQGIAKQHFEINVANVNRAPTVVSIANTLASENTPYRYHVLAQDPDLDGLMISLDDGPNGMTFNTSNNSLHWLPDFDDQGSHDVKLEIDDGETTITQQFIVQVKNQNRAPNFSSLSSPQASHLKATEGTQDDWQVTAKDNDGDDVKYELLLAPKGMTLDKNNGELTWTPNHDQSGTHEIIVKATDEYKAEDQLVLSINVKGVNRTPVIITQQLNNILEDQDYFFPIKATDPDQDKLMYTLLNGPTGMTLEYKKGYLNWHTDFNSAGTHPITIEVSDGTSQIQKRFELTVNNTNRAPVITSKPLLVASENRPYSSTILAKDADGDALDYKVTMGPKGMFMEKNRLIWTANFNQAGYHSVLIKVTDHHGSSTQQSFDLQVNNQNRPPAFTSSPITGGIENQQYRYALMAHDKDKDRLKYQLVSGPSTMTINGQALSWAPGFADAGKHRVTVQVSDGVKQIQQHFVIEVKNQNRPPKITTVAPSVTAENQLYEYSLGASDQDNHTLTFSLLTSPQGMTIDTHNGLIRWQTHYEDAGLHAVQALVTDTQGATALHSYQLNVKNVNRPPQFISKAVTAAKLLTEYRYGLKAQDPDWNTLNFEILKAPLHMYLDADDQVLYWPRDKVIEGTHRVELELSDGMNRVKQSFDIKVLAAPVDYLSR